MSGLSDSLREGAHAILEKATELQKRIRERAYQIWEREGREHGRDQDHWQRAERELAEEKANTREPAAQKVSRSRKKVSAASEGQSSGAASAGAATEAAKASRSTPKRKAPSRNASAIKDVAGDPASASGKAQTPHVASTDDTTSTAKVSQDSSKRKAAPRITSATKGTAEDPAPEAKKRQRKPAAAKVERPLPDPASSSTRRKPTTRSS
jgi:hypothetical protein